MTKVLVAFAVLLASQAARAATAYEALQILGKQKGEGVLDNVTEVRGDKGAPEPRTWKITARNPAGRGGAKEYSVAGKQITAERAASADGAALNMNQLSLDSDGAHTVAERQAKKAGFAYDHASYTLRAGTKSGSPVWEVRLSDEQSGSVGRVNIAATTGNVVSSDGLTNHRKAAVAAVPPAPAPVLEPEPNPAPRYQPAPEEPPTRYAPAPLSPGVQRASDSANQFFDRFGNHMTRRGRQIGDLFHNIFTGDRRDTAGPHGSPQSEPNRAPAPARRGDEDYVRPSRVRD